MKDNRILKYIRATVNLYRIIHKDKLVEIYNLQNDNSIDSEVIELFIEEHRDYLLQNYYACIKDDYFVSLSIMIGEGFEEELRLREGIPHYIPEKDELLKYADINYFEMTTEYEELRCFLRKLYWRRSKADEIANEVKFYCRSTQSFTNLIDLLVNIKVKNDNQFEELKLLSMQLYKNTRLEENNGYTPNELNSIMEQK